MRRRSYRWQGGRLDALIEPEHRDLNLSSGDNEIRNERWTLGFNGSHLLHGFTKKLFYIKKLFYGLVFDLDGGFVAHEGEETSRERMPLRKTASFLVSQSTTLSAPANALICNATVRGTEGWPFTSAKHDPGRERSFTATTFPYDTSKSPTWSRPSMVRTAAFFATA